MFLKKKENQILVFNVNDITDTERHRLDGELAKEITNDDKETYIYGVFMLGLVCNNDDKSKEKASNRLEKAIVELKRVTKEI